MILGIRASSIECSLPIQAREAVAPAGRQVVDGIDQAAPGLLRRALDLLPFGQLLAGARALVVPGRIDVRGQLEPYAVRIVEGDAEDDLWVHGSEYVDAVRFEPFAPGVDLLGGLNL